MGIGTATGKDRRLNLSNGGRLPRRPGSGKRLGRMLETFCPEFKDCSIARPVRPLVRIGRPRKFKGYDVPV